MQKLPETTSAADINNKLDELQKSYDLVVVLLNLITGLKTKLTLDLSPTCSELGNHAAFMVDCRDKIIVSKIVGLVSLLDSISTMQKSLDPANSMTNEEFNNTILKQDTN